MSEERFVWFTDDDNEILQGQYCSLCLKEIPEDEVPLLLFRYSKQAMERPKSEATERGDVDIARFHEDCAAKLINAGVIKLAQKKDLL